MTKKTEKEAARANETMFALDRQRCMPDGYKLAPIDCVNGWNVLKGSTLTGYEFLKIDGRIRRFAKRQEAIEYAWAHAGLKMEASEQVPEFRKVDR